MKPLNRGFACIAIHEVLVEQSITWIWKNMLELLRDGKGNVIIICLDREFFWSDGYSHWRFDSDVAPAMTLPDTVYQHMRDLAIKMMNGIGQFCGGCNVQFWSTPNKWWWNYWYWNQSARSRSSGVGIESNGLSHRRLQPSWPLAIISMNSKRHHRHNHRLLWTRAWLCGSWKIPHGISDSFRRQQNVWFGRWNP